MNALKYVGVVVAILAIVVAVLAAIAPKETNLERKIVVNQPQDIVFNKLASLEYEHKWSPWDEKDSSMKVEFRGVDGHVGSVQSWVGNDEVGEGEQEITKLEPNSYIEVELRFKKPFEATNTGYFKLSPVENGTEVTWGFHGENKFPMSIMMIFMNFEKMMGPDFEKGLSNFKNLIEKEG